MPRVARPISYGEQYLVSVSYVGNEGFWISKDLLITVPLLDDTREKDQHGTAESMARAYLSRTGITAKIKGVKYA